VDQAGLDPRDRDAMIRTVLTEAAADDPMGWAAVASTIRNRLATGDFGPTPSDVVKAPGQFEVWANGRAQAISPKHPNYEAAGRIVDAVAAGLPDPTGGATHFYSPSGQAALGRQPPKWGQDPIGNIGGQLFFAPQGKVTFPGAAAIEDATSGKQQVASSDDTFKRWGIDLGKSGGEAAAPAKDDSGDVFKRWGIDLAGDAKSAPAGQKSGSAAIPPGDAAAAVGAGIGDLPVVGPYVKEGMIRGAAAIGSVVNPALGIPAPSADQIRQWDAALKEAHPGAYAGGQALGTTAALLPLGGTALGAAALGARAPAFVTEASGALPALARLGTQAGIGGTTNALISGTDAYVRGENPLIAGGVGGVVGAAAPIAGVPLMAAGRGLAAAVEPFTSAGQQAIADRIIGGFAKGGPMTIQNNRLANVPGSVPTLAEATQNPGLASLQRGAESVRPNPFEARKIERGAAREDLTSSLKGDQASLENLIADRQAATDPLREAAFANAGKADATNVVQKIDEILKGPEGQRDAVVKALGTVKRKIVTSGGDAADPMAALTGGTAKPPTLESNPEQLYGIRKAIGDALSKTAAATGSDAKLASSELMAVKGELDKSIEGAAPGFKDYLSTYAEASKPINTQEYLQGLNLTDSRGKITLGNVDRAIKSTEKARSAGGANAAKSVPDDVMSQLYKLRDDLRGQQSVNDLGRPAGSNTFQNFATNNIASQLGMPLTWAGALTQNPTLAFGAHLLNQAYKSKNEAVMDALVNRLLTPQVPGSAAFTRALPGGQLPNYPALLAPGVISPNRNQLINR
jgi:hypothetical protein